MKELVLVKWDDSNVMHGWRAEGELSFDDVAHCRTIGMIVSNSPEKLTLAFGDSDCGSVMETITIPKGCIVSIRKLRVR